MKKFLEIIFSGIAGVLLTIGYQHYFAPEPTIIVNINGAEVEVTSDSYERLISKNEELKAENEELKAKNEELRMQLNDNTTLDNTILDNTFQDSLFEQWIIDSYGVSAEYEAIDSYGNAYTNTLILDGGDYIIYNLNNNYNWLKCNISPSRHISRYDGIITIKIDDKVIYTSPKIDILTETINIIIPLNNCSTLKIENIGDGYGDCIISDAVVYN